MRVTVRLNRTQWSVLGMPVGSATSNDLGNHWDCLDLLLTFSVFLIRCIACFTFLLEFNVSGLGFRLSVSKHVWVIFKNLMDSQL